MSRLNTRLLKTALHAMRASRADTLVAPFTRGAGVIFMLHNVGPETGEAFEPNRILRITPEFLEDLIHEVRASGFDFLALDDVPARLADPDAGPFACLTFDDGYRDNRDVALPILRRHGVPFAVYVASDYCDGKGLLWWLALETIVRQAECLSLTIDGCPRDLPARSTRDKYTAFHEIYWWLRRLPEDAARAEVLNLTAKHGVDLPNFAADLVMSWEELRDLAADPLATIGAHTSGHYALANLPADLARSQMRDSIARIEAELYRPCRHFSYPYGSEAAAGPREFAMADEFGMRTAVTTRKGLLHRGHADQLTALPRLSLNGEFQDIRFLRTLMTGAPFALMNTIDRLRAPLLASG